ncbi:hypothetical protein Lqui_0698 [Legionella quinlivanii]|uniref:Uncharacterized protein n=1 Tax=Legionella quinlivanii TaxID=45073 RepID=A0A0W0Y5I8_9GAMM|nr:hypothetical protein [Legionella quinlivanii]KTD51854.1 hypothetical protein Lqui_0698 [Legionella quinlivanii]SEF82959.1 hypothetical protein SAMN02746093_01157 [Legionella quinlivanii DSM 21216]STY09685.1 Uncharacterised protein [Legionella quinlivanii]
MPGKKNSGTKSAREAIIAPADQLSEAELTRLRQLSDHQQALIEQLAQFSSKKFEIAPQLMEGAELLDELGKFLEIIPPFEQRMRRIESNQLTTEDKASLIGLIEAEQKKLLNEKSNLEQQLRGISDGALKGATQSTINDISQKIRFLQTVIVSVEKNHITALQRMQLSLLMLPERINQLQKTLENIQPSYTHLQSLEKTPLASIITAASELYANAKAELNNQRSNLSEPQTVAVSQNARRIDSWLAEIEKLMQEFLSTRDAMPTAENPQNNLIKLSNLKWQLQHKHFEIRQGIKLMADELEINKKDAEINDKQQQIPEKTGCLKQVLAAIQLNQITLPQFKELERQIVSVLEENEKAAALAPLSKVELQWDNRSELAPALLDQRDTRLKALNQQNHRLDELSGKVCQTMEVEKQRLQPLQEQLILASRKQSLLVQLGLTQERKNLFRNFNLLFNSNFNTLQANNPGNTMHSVLSLFRWEDPQFKAEKLIAQINSETAAAKKQFNSNYPDLNIGSNSFQYNGKSYDSAAIISLLIANRSFLNNLPSFKTTNEDLKALINNANERELLRYLEKQLHDYLIAYTKLSTAFAEGANDKTDYSAALIQLNENKPVLDSMLTLAGHAADHERIIKQREQNAIDAAAAAEKAAQEQQLQKLQTEAAINNTVDILTAQLKVQLNKNLLLTQQVKEIIDKLTKEEQRISKKDPADPRISVLRSISQQVFAPFQDKLKDLNERIQLSSTQLTADTMETTKKELAKYVQETNQFVVSIPNQVSRQLNDQQLEQLSAVKQNAFLRLIDWLIRPLYSKRSDSLFATALEKNLSSFREKFVSQNQTDTTIEEDIDSIQIPQRN